MKLLPLTLLLLCISFSAFGQSNEFQLVAERNFGNPQVLGDKIVFTSSTDAAGSEIWVTDGTEAGTMMLLDIVPGPEDSNPYKLTKVGDKVFFLATSTEFGREIWVTDGTAAGTSMVKDILPGESGLDFFFYSIT